MLTSYLQRNKVLFNATQLMKGKMMKVIKFVSTPEDKYYQQQYVLDDGSHILISDKWGTDYMQHGKIVPQKNHRVRYAMNQALQSFLKSQAV